MRFVAIVTACLFLGCTTTPDGYHIATSPFEHNPEFLTSSFGIIWIPAGWQANTQERKAVLEHEKLHIRRMRQIGILAWHWCYFVDSAFRWDEEREAYELQYSLYPCYTPEALVALVTDPYYDGLITYTPALIWAEEVTRANP